MGIPGQYDENYYKFICIMLLCTFITSALLAIPTQRCIYRQVEWSRDAKIRNIVNVELVFLCVNAVAVSLFLIMLPLVFFIRCIYRQAEWSRDAKIRNIVNVELVFLCVNAVAVSLFLIMFPLIFFIMPSLAIAGGVLLRRIFIKSSLDALERKE